MSAENRITVNAAVISQTGNIRSNNEDNFFFDGELMTPDEVNQGACTRLSRTAPYHLFAICDGMGGLEGGERAAYIGIRNIRDLFRPIEEGRFQKAVSDYAMKATEEILADAEKTKKEQKEGTTMVLLYLAGSRGYVANIGDSRLYLLRRGKLCQISKDHSRVFQMMLRGELTREQMRKHPQANAINHYMGMPKEKIGEDYVHYETVQLMDQDRFLLCSDGLSDLMSFERLEEILSGGQTPMDTARALMAEALEMSGKDNTTIIVGDISGEFPPGPMERELPGINEEEEEDSPTER